MYDGIALRVFLPIERIENLAGLLEILLNLSECVRWPIVLPRPRSFRDGGLLARHGGLRLYRSLHQRSGGGFLLGLASRRRSTAGHRFSAGARLGFARTQIQ